MPWARPDWTALESERIVRTFRAHYLLLEDFAVGVFSPDERRVLGGTGFHLRKQPMSRRTAEVGLWIRSSDAHKGLGTRVLQAVLAWGFEEWPWLRLSWHASDRNVASQRTAEKAGMLREGIRRDDDYDPDGVRRSTIVYAATKQDWRPEEPGAASDRST